MFTEWLERDPIQCLEKAVQWEVFDIVVSIKDTEEFTKTETEAMY